MWFDESCFVLNQTKFSIQLEKKKNEGETHARATVLNSRGKEYSRRED